MVFCPRKRKFSPSKKYECDLHQEKRALVSADDCNFNFCYMKAKSARRLDYSSISAEDKENLDTDDSLNLNALRFYCKKSQYLNPLERKVLGVSNYRNKSDKHESKTKFVPHKLKLQHIQTHKKSNIRNVHRKSSKKLLKPKIQKNYSADSESYTKSNANNLENNSTNICNDLVINKSKENVKEVSSNLTCRKFFTSRNEGRHWKAITSSEAWKKGLRLKFKSGVSAFLNKSIPKVCLPSQDITDSLSLNKAASSSVNLTKELIIPLHRLGKKDILNILKRGKCLTTNIHEHKLFETESVSCEFCKDEKNIQPKANDCSSVIKIFSECKENGSTNSVFENNSFDLKANTFKSKFPVLLSHPTCNNDTSTVANSDRKEKEEAENNDQNLHESKKLNEFYPVFSLSTPKTNKRFSSKEQHGLPLSSKTSSNNSSLHSIFKFTSKTDGKEQLIIDAGQKDIGAKQCSVCNMVYTRGEPQDEKIHSSYHELFLSNLKFPGWKKEHVLGDFYDGRVLMVTRDDQNFKVKKLEDIMRIVDRDLGFPDLGLPCKMNATYILFISNDKKVVGCLVAESITKAYRVVLDTSSKYNAPCLPTDTKMTHTSGNTDISEGIWCSSCEPVKALCGISRIWTSFGHRRCKIASRMVDCLRCNFIYGYALSMDEVAFSDPSLDGRAFAASYTGTPYFLVYK